MGRGKLAPRPRGETFKRRGGRGKLAPRPRGETFKRRVEVAWKREARPGRGVKRLKGVSR